MSHIKKSPLIAWPSGYGGAGEEQDSRFLTRDMPTKKAPITGAFFCGAKSLLALRHTLFSVGFKRYSGDNDCCCYARKTT
jgi:hypothetical protein